MPLYEDYRGNLEKSVPILKMLKNRDISNKTRCMKKWFLANYQCNEPERSPRGFFSYPKKKKVMSVFQKSAPPPIF